MNPIEYKGQRVITTEQMAKVYGTDGGNIRNNFSNHKGNFQPGKHYFLLTGGDLKAFKNDINNIGVVAPNGKSTIPLDGTRGKPSLQNPRYR